MQMLLFTSWITQVLMLVCVCVSPHIYYILSTKILKVGHVCQAAQLQ